MGLDVCRGIFYQNLRADRGFFPEESRFRKFSLHSPIIWWERGKMNWNHSPALVFKQKRNLFTLRDEQTSSPSIWYFRKRFYNRSSRFFIVSVQRRTWGYFWPWSNVYRRKELSLLSLGRSCLDDPAPVSHSTTLAEKLSRSFASTPEIYVVRACSNRLWLTTATIFNKTWSAFLWLWVVRCVVLIQLTAHSRVDVSILRCGSPYSRFCA